MKKQKNKKTNKKKTITKKSKQRVGCDFWNSNSMFS